MGLNYKKELHVSISPQNNLGEKRQCGIYLFFFFESFKSVNKHLTQWFSAEAEPLPRGSFRTFELTFLDCHNVWGYDWHLVNGNQRR